MTRLATICCRAGSKGVPLKGLRDVAGKPLSSWTIEQALSCGLFDAVVVDSDDQQLLELATELGVEHTVTRPAELADDHSSKLVAIEHAVEWYEKSTGDRVEVIVDLDITAPLRTVDDIRGAIALFDQGAGNVITGCRARRSPYFNLVEQLDDQVRPACVADPPLQRRQDAPVCFDMNGAVYVWRRDRFMAGPYVFDDQTQIFEMPADRSIDIDEEFDLEVVEWLLNRRLAESGQGESSFSSQHRSTPSTPTDPDGLGGPPRGEQVTLVSGGCGNIGVVLCRQLAAEADHRVVLIDHPDRNPQDQARSITSESGGQVLGLALDLADLDEVDAIVSATMDLVGPPTGLVNLAATKGDVLTDFMRPPEDYRSSTWQRVMSVNVDGLFFLTRTCGSLMAQAGGGSIVNVSSIYGHLGPDHRIYDGESITSPTVYSASKAAVHGITQHLATWWGSQGVRVNTVSPGGVAIDLSDRFVDLYSARVPMGRMAQTTEITAAIRFLLSAQASYITGQNLMVDGGLSAW